jgi:serine/threonine protein kinase
MIRIPGYEIEEVVVRKDDVCVYRATAVSGGRPVILKSSLEGAVTPRVLARIAHEFEVTRELDSDGVIRPIGMEHHSDGVALVFEDYQGRPLNELINGGELNVDYCLRIATRLARTLGDIHAQQLIHKDIKPQNVLIDGEGRARIIDFGISERINLKNRHLGNPEVLEGTLAYISPEQTGRMNRVLDYRSDLYSLGVTFYEMLTGRLPFETRDSMELVYSHIAHRPTPVSQRNPEIPGVLSDIIDRLLAKNAEDRYQSAYGLNHDLEECLRRLDGVTSNRSRSVRVIFPDSFRSRRSCTVAKAK